jgi:hypothetical protein
MANDGSVTSSEVIDQEAVRAEVESVAEENLVFRRAFREIDSTDIDSNTVEVPVNQDVSTEAGVVSEGSAFPRTEDEQVEKVAISHDKYGTEVEITYESIQDSLLDVIALHTEDKARDLAEALDGAAYAELSDYDSTNSVYNNLQDSPIGDDAGDLSYDNVVDAMTALEGEGYEPDLLIVSAQSKGDLMKSPEFTRASQMGDEVVREGAFGEVAGIPVYVSNTGDLGAGEGVMVDSDRYGMESVREDFTSDEYDEPEKNQRVVQVRTRMGWKCLQPTAGVKIEG